MDNITKITVLDKCIAGSIDKMNQLLDTSSEHFDLFYSLCKTIHPKNISDITFSEMDDCKASFIIKTPKAKPSSELFKEVETDNIEVIHNDAQHVNVIISVHSNQ